MKGKTTLIVVVAVLIIASITIMLLTRSPIETSNDFTVLQQRDKSKIPPDTYFHVKSVKVIQPFYDKARVYIVLDSPEFRIDSADVAPDYAASILGVAKMKYCLFNLKAHKLIGSDEPLILK